MSCQLTAGPHRIDGTATAWIVVAMCEPWYHRDRDAGPDGWSQDLIHNSSIRAAAREVPSNMDEFRQWCESRKVACFWLNKMQEEEFTDALRFIRQVATTFFDAHLHHEELVF